MSPGHVSVHTESTYTSSGKCFQPPDVQSARVFRNHKWHDQHHVTSSCYTSLRVAGSAKSSPRCHNAARRVLASNPSPIPYTFKRLQHTTILMLERGPISNIHLKSFCSRRCSSECWLCPHRDWAPPLCTPRDPGTPDVFLPGSAGCLQSATEILRVKVRAWVSKAPCHLQRNLPHTNQQTNTAPGRCATEFGRCFLITRCKIKINGVAEGWMQNDCFSCPFCATSQLMSFYDINRHKTLWKKSPVSLKIGSYGTTVICYGSMALHFIENANLW